MARQFSTQDEKLFNAHGEYLRKAFPDLPHSETVIQSYRCKYVNEKGKKNRGRCYITQNYFCFKSSDLTFTIVIPFSQIIKVERKDSLKFIKTQVIFNLENGISKTFRGFMYRNDVFFLVNYLCNFAPIFYRSQKVELKLPEPEPEPIKPVEQPKSVAQPEINSFFSPPAKEPEKPKLEGRWANFEVPSASEYIKVDVETSEKAVRVAEQIVAKQAETRNVILEQTKTIDRIERDVDASTHFTKQANHKLNKIEGGIVGLVKGSVGDLVTGDIKFVPLPDREIGSVKGADYCQFPVLYKRRALFHLNEYTPALLRIHQKKVGLFEYKIFEESIDSADFIGELITAFKVRDLVSIILLTHPNHLTIHFNNQQDIILMSSFNQLITNEFVLLLDNQIGVLFNPSSRPFHYNDPSLRNYEVLVPDGSELGDLTFSRGKSLRMTETILQNVNKEVKKDMEKMEENIEKLVSLTNQMQANANETGDALHDNVQVLKRVNEKVDKLNISTEKVAFKAQSKT